MSYHHGHHHQQPEYVEEYCESERVYAPAPAPYAYDRVDSGCYERSEGRHGYSERSEGRRHGYEHGYARNERLGELGAVAAGAFAVYEGHKATTDPTHASKHKHEAEVAALGAAGSTGYAYYEHRKKEACSDEFRY